MARKQGSPTLLPAKFYAKGTKKSGQNDNFEAWNEFYGHWHSIMKSPDERTFFQRLLELQHKYLPKYKDKVGYIKTAWLDPYKRNF